VNRTTSWVDIEVSAVTDTPVRDVWRCLADPWSYTRWVAGTAAVRAADPNWPDVGAALHHRWGPWPVQMRDRSVVTGCEAPRRLDLDARVGPIAQVQVSIRLGEQAGRTRIVLRETVVRGWATRCPALTRRIQQWRNRRSLNALVALAAGPAPGRGHD
jgi:hypothetical protein